MKNCAENQTFEAVIFFSHCPKAKHVKSIKKSFTNYMEQIDE